MGTGIKYRSAVSNGLLIPVSIVMVIAAVTTILSGESVPMIILGLVIFGVVVPIFANTNYTIANDMLVVRSGWVVNIAIPINSIKQIQPTKSILSAPALSVSERIEITYNKYDSVVISPRSREVFIAELLRINPSIQISA